MLKHSEEDAAFIKSLGLKNPLLWLATWFGFGLMKPAPGTWGSLAALPFGVLLFEAFEIKGLAIAVVWVTWLGIWVSDKIEQQTNIHDSKMIVIDEVAGMWIALLAAGFDGDITLIEVALSFVLFRFFDILKPWPIGWIDDKIKGGLGVMLDDVAAGIFAGIVLIGVGYGFG